MLDSQNTIMYAKPNPEMLILAREVRGISQTEIAEASKISQANVSRYENGLSIIPKTDLEILARTLDFPVGFFYRTGNRYGAESGELFHRKRRSVSSSDLKRLQGLLNLFRLNVEILLEGVDVKFRDGIPRYDVKTFQGSIEDIASNVRGHWNMLPGRVQDVMEVIENGFSFIFAYDFGIDKIDELVQWIEPNPPIFLVNSRASGDRLRFSLAHALGHLVMHHTLEPYPEMESEADQFAAAFLMPAADIMSDFQDVTLEKLIRLKSKWKVSIQALIYRAHELEKISDRKYTSMFEMLSRAGYRKSEPFPLPVEQPALFKKLWDSYQNNSVTNLAQILDVHEYDLQNWYFHAPQKPPIKLISKTPPDIENGDRRFRSG